MLFTFQLLWCILLVCLLLWNLWAHFIPFLYSILANYHSAHSQWSSIPSESSGFMRLDTHKRAEMDNNEGNKTCNATISMKQYQVSAQMMAPHQQWYWFFYRKTQRKQLKASETLAFHCSHLCPERRGPQSEAIRLKVPWWTYLLHLTLRLLPSLRSGGKQNGTGTLPIFLKCARPVLSEWNKEQFYYQSKE